MRGRDRLWWCPKDVRLLYLGVIDEPQIRWDMDLNLAGIPIPAAVEDEWLSWSVRRVLAMFDDHRPFRIFIEHPIPAEILAEGAEMIRLGIEATPDDERPAVSLEVALGIDAGIHSINVHDRTDRRSEG